jgi:hypothetical protein
MKQVYYFVLSVVLVFTTSFSNGNTLMEGDSVTMGAGYANDIYYSYENGEVSSVVRTNWDLAFFTSPWSAGILTNGAAGVELYPYPLGDTSAWNAIDSTGLASWPVSYNSPDEWEDGAFNRFAMGHPDYGWGVYNVVNHDVVGDSLYLIKLMDGNMKKLWIQRKASMMNTFYFKFADLDGSNEVEKVLDCNPYTDKNFVYYSMQSDEVLDREPDSDSWDILFTKYMGINNDQPYPVTGALSNVNVPANKNAEVGPDFEDWFAVPMDSTKSPIGYDWKYFDMGVFNYVVEDSIAYFTRSRAEDVYKLVFSAFNYMDGKIVFDISLTSPAAVSEINNDAAFLIYPNPASRQINIEIIGSENWNEILITDISGRVVLQTEVSVMNHISIPVEGLSEGVYFVGLKSDNTQKVQKLIIQNN